MYASWAGLALVLLYTLGQWRQIAAWFGHRNARYGTLASVSVLVGLGILVAVNYLANRAEQAVGPDREPAVHAVGPDGRSCCRA